MMVNTHDKSGLAAVLPTYEAYSFGQKNSDVTETAGPGPGKYALPSTLGTAGHRYGPGRARAPPSLVHGPFGPFDSSHLSTNPGPHYTFGSKALADQNKNPGPGEYQAPTLQPLCPKTGSWGPSHSVRQTVLVPITWAGPAKDTRIGITMKAPFQTPHTSAITPAPHDYQPMCACSCKNCCQNHGASFGLRTSLPTMAWGTGPSFNPSTLGAASVMCKSGSWPHLIC